MYVRNVSIIKVTKIKFLYFDLFKNWNLKFQFEFSLETFLV